MFISAVSGTDPQINNDDANILTDSKTILETNTVTDNSSLSEKNILNNKLSSNENKVNLLEETSSNGVYYVSTEGNDDNDGLTINSFLMTILIIFF
jgi:hypothetical protein